MGRNQGTTLAETSQIWDNKGRGRPMLTSTTEVWNADKAAHAGRPAPDTVEPLSGERFPALTEPPPRLEPIPGDGLPVTMVTPSLAAGGAERQMVDLACGLAALDYRPVVVTTGSQVPAHPGFLAKLQRHGVPCGQRAPFGEINPTLARGKATLWWGACLRHCPALDVTVPGSVYISHSAWDRGVDMVMEVGKAGALEHGVGVCGPAARLFDTAANTEGTPTVWNGIEPDEIPVCYRPRNVGDPFTLGFLGRMSEEKQLHLAVEALAVLPERFRLRLWGWGPVKPALAQQAAEMGVDHRMDLMGKPGSRAEALTGLDALFLVSRGEGFPLTLIEAAISHIPVITPPPGDLALGFEHGKRGSIIEPTAASLALAAMTLADDPERAWEMAGVARTFALEHMTVARMVAGYTHVIQQVAQ